MQKIFILFLLGMLLHMAGWAQQTTFPQNFTGHWKGTIHWLQAGRPTQEFSMQLKVKELGDTMGLYHWYITYGDSALDERPYTLKPVDIAKGHWVIDEANGIVLDQYVFDNCLQGSFTVMNNTIINSYCVENEQMKVEFFTVKLKDKKTTGKGTEDSPTVDSYRMGGYQYGILKKVK